jgi:hypothetical protein
MFMFIMYIVDVDIYVKAEHVGAQSFFSWVEEESDVLSFEWVMKYNIKYNIIK